jgi:tetratricopeptide (TPR) repeat protein
MAVVARGTVADRPWGRTFAFVASRAFTGDLVLTSDGKRYAVGWRGGAVVAASSPLAADAVARIALTAQLVTSSQVSDILRTQAAAPHRDEIDVVAEAVQLTPELAMRLRRRVLAARAMRTFAIAAGDFVLDADPQLPQQPELAIDARALAFSGARQHFGDARLLEELAGLGLMFRLKDEAVHELGQYGFGDSERPALQVLRERAVSPHELEQACPDADPKALRAMLYALACFAAVEARGTAAPRSASPSQPPASRPSSPTPTPYPRPPTPRTQPPIMATRSPSTPPPVQAQFARTPTTTPPPVRAKPASDPPPRVKPTSTPPPPMRSTDSVPPPVPVPAAPSSSSEKKSDKVTTGEWSEASSPAIRRARARVRSSTPPTTTARADADAIRALIAERLQRLDRGVDHFELLGVGQDADAMHLRAVYFSLARQLHPDRLAAAGVSDERREAQRLFAQINAAFGVLSNPRKKSEYLSMLSQGGVAQVRADEDAAEKMAAQIFGAEEHFRKGEMALRRDQLDIAHAEFKAAVAMNPNDGEHHALLAWTTYATAPDKTKIRGDLRKLFDEATRLAPRSVTPFLYLGRIARLDGKDADAIEHFNRVLQMMPGHSEAASELRVLEARRGQRPSKPPETKPDKDKPKGLFGFIKKS